MIRGDKGFTVLELLISVLLSGIVVSAAMSLYITGHKQMVTQDEIADLQGGVRASAELIAKHVRMAGYNVPVSINPMETFDTNPDTIVITYDSDKLKNVEMQQDMADESSPIRCAPHDLDQLSAGDWVYVFDPSTVTGEFCLASDINRGDAVIMHGTMPLSRAYPAGTKVMELNHIKLYVDRTDSSRTNLMIQTLGSSPEVFAENISDLDFRYIMRNGVVVNQTIVPTLIRMVEINVTAKSPNSDSDFGNIFRTRKTTFRVKVRNL